MVNVQRATISFFFRKQLVSKGQERLCLGSACTLSGLTGVIFPVAEQLCQHSKAAQWSHEHGGTDWLLGHPRVTRYLCNSMSLKNDITQNIVILLKIIWKTVDVPGGIRPQVNYRLVLSLIHVIYCGSFYPRKTFYSCLSSTLSQETSL